MGGISKKQYTIKVASHVYATMSVWADSRLEAQKVAYAQMSESLERKLKEASPRYDVTDMHGYVEAQKSTVKLKKEECQYCANKGYVVGGVHPVTGEEEKLLCEFCEK